MKEEDRWEVIRLHKDGKMSLRQIAKQFKCDDRTIRRIIRCYKETGTPHDRHSSGRPSTMKDELLNTLDSIISKHDTYTSNELAATLQNKTGRRVSPRTIRRVRRTTLARHPVHETIERSFTQGEKGKRLSFATAHATDDFHCDAFADEAWFSIDSTGRVHWHRRGEHHPSREVKDTKVKFMVWGAVGWWGKSELCVCEKNVDASYYIDILGEYLVPFMPNFTRYHLVHDNAPAHVAKKTKEWLAAFGVKVLPNYPPWSPDLNPIEHVWSWMHAFVSAQAPTTATSLERAIRLAWQEIKLDTIRGYITNLRSVCQRVIAAEGDHI
jgi:transposase